MQISTAFVVSMVRDSRQSRQKW